jgi:ABC-type transport system involved in cytochrome c biogenesis permease subunit
MGKDMIDRGAELVRLLLYVGPSLFDGLFIAIVDDGEWIVKIPLIVIFANLAPICLAFLLGSVYGVLVEGEPRDAEHFILLVGEAGGHMSLPFFLSPPMPTPVAMA